MVTFSLVAHYDATMECIMLCKSSGPFICLAEWKIWCSSSLLFTSHSYTTFSHNPAYENLRKWDPLTQCPILRIAMVNSLVWELFILILHTCLLKHVCNPLCWKYICDNVCRAIFLRGVADHFVRIIITVTR
jgi:hypothetical protein